MEIKKKQKVWYWPQRLVPDPDYHKLENEQYVSGMDVFGGHNEYRPDCVTRSGMWRGPDCGDFTIGNDPLWYIDQASYGLPGDYYEDAVR